MVRGSILSVCASHSAAIASAIWRDGTVTTRPDGVRIGLPSSVTEKPPSASLTPARAYNRLRWGVRVARRTNSCGSSGDCPATSSNSSRMRLSASFGRGPLGRKL